MVCGCLETKLGLGLFVRGVMVAAATGVASRHYQPNPERGWSLFSPEGSRYKHGCVPHPERRNLDARLQDRGEPGWLKAVTYHSLLYAVSVLSADRESRGKEAPRPFFSRMMRRCPVV